MAAHHRKLLCAVLVFSLGLSGCTNMDQPGAGVSGTDTSAPGLTPEEEGFPSDMTREDVPETVAQAVEGGDEGFVDKTGFFITVGEGVAALGDPTITGIWVRASFIKAEEELKIYSRQTDMSVLARAIPYDGNMQMSLAAFQALSLSPAELVEIEVRTP